MTSLLTQANGLFFQDCSPVSDWTFQNVKDAVTLFQNRFLKTVFPCKVSVATAVLCWSRLLLKQGN